MVDDGPRLKEAPALTATDELTIAISDFILFINYGS